MLPLSLNSHFMRLSIALFFTCFIVLSISAQEKTELKKSEFNFEFINPLDRITIPKGERKVEAVQKVPKIFKAECLPIFCKIEHKLAKSSKVNVMMRLGSLDYVNKLEGKN